MEKTKRYNRIKTLGRYKFYSWVINDKIWKILNKIFRANYHSIQYKPKWISLKLWMLLRKTYKKSVLDPYEKMTLQEMKEDFSRNPNLQKFEKYLN